MRSYSPTPSQSSSSAGSPPGTSSQVPLPASQTTTRSPSPHPTWRSPTRELSSDSDDNAVARLLTDDVTENLSTLVEPSHTPAPPITIPTPSSIAISLPSTYASPNPESLYSDSEFQQPAVRRSDRKGKATTKYIGGTDANLIASDESLAAIDEAYYEGVELFITATSHGEPHSYREATQPGNPDSPHWIAAIEAELKSLQDHGTWKVRPTTRGKTNRILQMGMAS
jgi:hypothetical protein